MSELNIVADVVLKRLRWQCRRGMKEMDALLVGWLERFYLEADAAKQQRFAHLLQTEDDVLWRWLAGRGAPDSPELAALIHEIVASAEY